jgi:hypothetical protein
MKRWLDGRRGEHMGKRVDENELIDISGQD